MNDRHGTPTLDAVPVYPPKTALVRNSLAGPNLSAHTPNSQLNRRVDVADKRIPEKRQVRYTAIKNLLRYHDRPGQRLVKPVDEGRSILKKPRGKNHD